MATHQTDLKFKADTSAIKKAGQEIKQAFSPEQLKKFRAATADLEKQYGDLTKSQMKLTKALKGVEEGSDAYKKLKDQIKGVRTETDLVSKSMAQLDRIQQRAARQQQAISRQTSAGGLRNFGAGLAQGSGIAQYIPSGPGMGSRIAGAALAGGARRGAMAAASPFLTPGIGGVAQGLGAIPLIGGAAAGALQTAAASYQSAVGYARARHQNLFFANASMGRDLGTTANPEYAAAQAAVDEARAAVNAPVVLTKTQKKNAARKKAVRESFSLNRRPGFGFGMRGLVPAPSDEPIIAQKRSDRNDIIQQRKDALAKAQKHLAETDMLRSLGVASGLGSIGLGTSLGFDPTQTEGMKGQFMGARGGTFNQSQFMEAMLAQVAFGASQQQSGAFARGGLAGGGGVRGQSLMQTLRGGEAQGLRGAQIGEYLQTLVELQKKAESQGIKLDPAAFTKMSMQLNVSGFKGLQAQRVAGGFTSAAQGLSARGASSPMDAMMLRAAGFDPGQGIEGYAKAMRKLEKPDQKLLNNAMNAIREGTEGMGPESRAMITKRAFKAMNIDIGMDQADAFINAGKTPSIAKLQARQESSKSGSYRNVQNRITKGGADLTVGAAQLQQDTIEQGVRSAKWVEALAQNSLKMGDVMNNFGVDLTALSSKVKVALAILNAGTKGGLAGTSKKITAGGK